MRKFRHNNFLKNAKTINEFFFVIMDKLKLDSIWNKENCLEIEIKKSFIKSLIRYDIKTNDLLKEVLSSHYKTINKNFSYTNFYPMIHLSGDIVENGGYHFDQVDLVNLHTLWIAISEYNYPSLSIFNFNSKNTLINKILIKSKIAKIFSKDVYSKQGDLNIWDGKLIHAGNFNNSLKPAIALQMKVMLPEDDFTFEETNDYSKKSNFDANNTDISSISDDYSIFSKIISKILLQSQSNQKIIDDFSDLVKIIKKNPNIQNHKFSFGMSILSQRIRSFKKIFLPKIKNIDKFTSSLDYISILIGSENLVSFKRLYSEDIKKKYILENILKNDIFNVCGQKYEKFKAIIKLH